MFGESTWDNFYEMQNKGCSIAGYLECDGSIVKISSIDDINNFIARFGKSINELTEQELDGLASKEGETTSDDCGVKYLKIPPVLKNGVIMESYKIREGTIAIGDNSFNVRCQYYNKRNILKAVKIPNSVIVIGKGAFYSNHRLQIVDFSDSIKKIGDNAFCGCSLMSIDLPKSLLYIGKSAFANNPVQSIVIPESVKKIESYAFKSCRELRMVTFHGLPESFGNGIFASCSKLQEIIIPYGTTEYYLEKLFPLSKDMIFENSR